ncbi:hypothetical protein TgHK011_007693 [Trichoderma gracile]|nr:hypothetical protein TgHK011_007693 [Trichoderma gracile]
MPPSCKHCSIAAVYVNPLRFELLPQLQQRPSGTSLFSQSHNMAFQLLKRLTLLFVLLGLVLADKGIVPLEVVTLSMHAEEVGRWTYYDNSSLLENVTAASPSASLSSPSPGTDRRRFKAELTDMIMQEPGFVLLSLSFMFISGGMVFL